MKDIQNRADLETIMTRFYTKLLRDDSIRFIFTDIASINLEHHLPVITDFWEKTILNSGSYNNNVLQVHQELNTKIKLTENHFSVWLLHFEQTIDELFSGENSEKLKTRALSLSTVMKIKLNIKNN